MNFFYKESKSILRGGGLENGFFFFTKNPNLKLGGGGRWGGGG